MGCIAQWAAHFFGFIEDGTWRIGGITAELMCSSTDRAPVRSSSFEIHCMRGYHGRRVEPGGGWQQAFGCTCDYWAPPALDCAVTAASPCTERRFVVVVHRLGLPDGVFVRLADANPYHGLDTATVLQQCRAFHDPVMVSRHPRKCCEILTRLLYLMAQGFKLTSSDTTAKVFFGVTKLFSSDNLNLRRLVYLFLKEVAETSNPSDIIIVVQSLIKDFNETSHEILQANALRVLTRIVDATTLTSLDRYYREAISDTSPSVAMAGLTSGVYLLRDAGTTEVVRRWVGEIQSKLSTTVDPMVKYHALCLLHSLKSKDNLGISRLLTNQIAKTDFGSTLAVTVLVRYTAGLLRRDIGALDPRQAYDFLESCTRCSSNIVRVEAARAICNLPGVASSDVRPAVDVLRRGLGSASAAHRFACVRTLAQVAQSYPTEVETANTELERMLSDSRIIATYAIVTLLKTGSGANMAKLLKHIHGFLSDLTDEFKVVIARAVHDMALRFASSYEAILNFVSNALREEGSFEFKRELVDIKVDLMERVPECRVTALAHLCEFIEDCEYTPLCTRVLHLLGDAGPSSPSPSTLIRFIYNRLLLEAAPVRAAAVTALTKFATSCASLRPSILTLLSRARHDDDDEVRDRCALSISVIERLEAEAAASEGRGSEQLQSAASSLATGALPMPIAALQKALRLYQLHPKEGAFRFEDLPAVEGATAAAVTYADTARQAMVLLQQAAKAKDEAKAAASTAAKPRGRANAAAPTSGVSASAMAAAGGDAGMARLLEVPELAAAGPLFRTSRSSRLTEDECEYAVTCRRHVFNEHVIFDFEVTNTVAQMQLERVTVQLEPADEAAAAWETDAVVAAPVAKHGEPVHVFVSLVRSDTAGFAGGSFTTTLKFFPVDVDMATGEPQGSASYEEDFAVENAAILASDFVIAKEVVGFRAAWEAIPDDNMATVKQSSPAASVAQGASKAIAQLGLAPCDNSGAVASTATKAHVLLSGIFLGGVHALARVQFMVHPTAGVLLRAMAKTDGDPAIARHLLAALSS